MLIDRLIRLHLTAGVFFLLMQALFLTGCGPATPAAGERGSGTAVVVFIDFSQSISNDDRASFRREIEADIMPSLVAGDRLLIAPIHEKTLTDFRPLVDAELPPKPKFNGFFDNVMKFNREAKAVDAEGARIKEKVQAQVAHLFTKRYVAMHTDIFSSLLIAQKLFHEEKRHKVLVLMSDMIEDNPPYSFEKIAWNPATIERMLSELDGKGLLPKLAGVCVYVSGASANSAAVADNIGRFWQAYFRRAGADMDASRYAHVLLHWPPAKSCRPSGAPRGV
jgi:hypothetical protein